MAKLLLSAQKDTCTSCPTYETFIYNIAQQSPYSKHPTNSLTLRPLIHHLHHLDSSSLFPPSHLIIKPHISPHQHPPDKTPAQHAPSSPTSQNPPTNDSPMPYPLQELILLSPTLNTCFQTFIPKPNLYAERQPQCWHHSLFPV